MGCLSRMRGNLHVRFLGEGVAARPPPYPPRAVGSIPIARSTPSLAKLPMPVVRGKPLAMPEVVRIQGRLARQYDELTSIQRLDRSCNQ